MFEKDIYEVREGQNLMVEFCFNQKSYNKNFTDQLSRAIEHCRLFPWIRYSDYFDVKTIFRGKTFLKTFCLDKFKSFWQPKSFENHLVPDLVSNEGLKYCWCFFISAEEKMKMKFLLLEGRRGEFLFLFIFIICTAIDT